MKYKEKVSGMLMQKKKEQTKTETTFHYQNSSNLRECCHSDLQSAYLTQLTATTPNKLLSLMSRNN